MDRAICIFEEHKFLLSLTGQYAELYIFEKREWFLLLKCYFDPIGEKLMGCIGDLMVISWLAWLELGACMLAFDF